MAAATNITSRVPVMDQRQPTCPETPKGGRLHHDHAQQQQRKHTDGQKVTIANSID